MFAKSRAEAIRAAPIGTIWRFNEERFAIAFKDSARQTCRGTPFRCKYEKSGTGWIITKVKRDGKV